VLNPHQVVTRQFFILTIGLYVGDSILVVPSLLAHTAREDAWLATLFTLLLNILMVGLYLLLTRVYPGKNLFQIHMQAFGKIMGAFVNVLYLIYFEILVGTLVGNLGFFLSSEFMPETPIEANQVLFLVTVIISATLGLIILARFGELLFPWLALLFLVLVVALVPQIHWDYVQPVLEDGWGPVLRAGFHSALFQELVVLLAFFPLIKGEKKEREKAFITATGIGGLALTIIVALSVLVLGIEQTENSTFPAFALAKAIHVGQFFQRVEGLLIALWIITFFIKVGLLFAAILQGIQDTFGIKRPQVLIYPLAVMFLVVAWNTYIDTIYVADMIENVWGGYALLYLVVIPLLALAIGLCRRKWGHHQGQTAQQ
jgi:spore germination protein KB